MKFRRLILILVLTLALPWAAVAAGTEDPYYRQWASFKVGSSVTLTGTATSSESGDSSFKQTITLKEVKSDHLVIHIVRVEGSKRTDKSKKVERFLGKTDKLEDLGQEDITAAGKRFKCHKYKLTYFYDDGKEMISFTYWFHPDIPGAAQILARAKNPAGKTVDTATQTAVSWEKK
ncbi:MAG: hypothetical protein A2Y80_03570 [Deltaproteobacteria bacterium RBG_13_58_19]|nr:MAG: hypothetical protein A2Y80_03570 [Deltaproteobacteria bacterium RBG_13_58_19]